MQDGALCNHSLNKLKFQFQLKKKILAIPPKRLPPKWISREFLGDLFIVLIDFYWTFKLQLKITRKKEMMGRCSFERRYYPVATCKILIKQ